MIYSTSYFYLGNSVEQNAKCVGRQNKSKRIPGQQNFIGDTLSDEDVDDDADFIGFKKPGSDSSDDEFSILTSKHKKAKKLNRKKSQTKTKTPNTNCKKNQIGVSPPKTLPHIVNENVNPFDEDEEIKITSNSTISGTGK